MQPQDVSKSKGIIDSIKEWWSSVDLEKIFGESSSNEAVQVAICFVSFFAIGFLFKKYLKIIFIAAVLAFLIIKGLEYQKILDIDREALNQFLGFEPTATFGTMATSALEWVKAHVVISIASVLGFLIGCRLG